MNMKTVSAQQSVKGNAGKSLPSAHKRLYAALGFSLCMLAPGLASAMSVSIDDLTDMLSVNTDIPSVLVQITREGVGILGGADLYFEYQSTDPSRPVPGVASVLNYNIFSPLSQRLSDTLSITISGHTHVGGGGDQNNVSVDMHFRSDSGDEIPPPRLVNATDILETGQYQLVNSGLSDLNVQFRSDVSEVPVPAAAWLLGSGLLGLVGVARRKSVGV